MLSERQEDWFGCLGDYLIDSEGFYNTMLVHQTDYVNYYVIIAVQYSNSSKSFLARVISHLNMLHILVTMKFFHLTHPLGDEWAATVGF